MASGIPERVTLWTLEAEDADPEYFGKVDLGGATTLEALRFTLESHDILEWPFDFWDEEDKRRVKKKLERLNGFSNSVHVIRCAEGEFDPRKRRRTGDFVFPETTTQNTTPAEVAIPATQLLDAAEDEVLLHVSSSRVSASADSPEVENNPMRSLLLPNHVMDLYLERAKKCRAELKRVSLDDHEWWLKTFDLNGSGIVKLWCAECKKDCRGDAKDHTKSQIDNLFNNFRRSHIVSTGHVRNYCAAHNINFDDHPQSQAKKGKTVTLTSEDHKDLISEGVGIVERVNAGLPEGHRKFNVLGNNNG